MLKSRLQFAILLALVIFMFVGVSACSAQKTYVPTKENPLILRLQVSGAAGKGPIWQLVTELKQNIENLSNGTTIIELYGMGTLCQTPADIAPAIRDGIVDIGWIHPSYTPGLLPKSELLMIPIIWPTGENLIKFNAEVMQKYIETEWLGSGLKPMFPPQKETLRQIFSTKPLRTLSDFKGVKISATSEYEIKVLERLGFSPINMPGAETYTALQKGIIDAALMLPWAAEMSKYQEVCKYIILLNFYTNETYVGWAMNPKRYSTLPVEIQKQIKDELSRISLKYNTSQEQWNSEALGKLEKAGLVKVQVDNNQIYLIMKDAAESLINDWIVSQEKKGNKDAKQYAEYCLKLRDKYSSK